MILENEPLKQYTSYLCGGTARYFSMPNSIEELEAALTWADALDMPHEVIGHGANILASDSGYAGLVICLRSFENWVVHNGDTILAGAGAALNNVVHYACDLGLKGMESLAGIPGSIGGALRMNAGAFGTEMGDVVSRINVLEGSGELRQIVLNKRVITNAEAGFGYRKAMGLSGKIVLGAEFCLGQTAEDLNAVRLDIMKRRMEKQPLEYASCGSVFKRPEGGFAGTLIEGAGLKGFRIGGAQVSEKHANFIVNLGDATASDVYNVIQYVKYTVYKKTGVMLEEEVRFLGEFSTSS